MSTADSSSLKRILCNLASLLLAGALCSCWILFYTDWFPAIGGLLTLTGAFAWIAFLVHLISEERKKEIQAAFEQKLLASHTLWVQFVILIGTLLLLTLCTGTIEIRSYYDSSQRFEIHSVNSTEAPRKLREGTLLASSTRKFLLFGHGPFRVRLTGLPDIDVNTSSFLPRVVVSPDDFVRNPVLLLRPEAALSDIATAQPLTLKIFINDGPPLSLPFTGKAIWVGCDRDVQVPNWIYQSWRKDAALKWLPPIDTGSSVRLNAGDKINVRLESLVGIYNEYDYTILPANGLDFVQEFVFAEPI